MPSDNVRREYYAAETKIGPGLMLGIALAVIGLAILALGEPMIVDAELIGAVTLVLAAIVLAISWRGARYRRARLVLDEDGVWYRDWGIGNVPWRDIARASLGGSQKQAFLRIELRDAPGFLVSLTKSEQKRLQRNRLVRLPNLRVRHGALDAPLEEILAAIETCIRASR
jgi:hypothetical protein